MGDQAIVSIWHQQVSFARKLRQRNSSNNQFDYFRFNNFYLLTSEYHAFEGKEEKKSTIISARISHSDRSNFDISRYRYVK